MTDKHPIYYAYLLRVWRDGPDNPWRATLEDPHTGDVIGFATIEQLYDFIQSQVAENPQKDE